MRGQLLLASARTPYMRAGLSWATREALRLDIRELDGARLLELLDDPVVTVSVGGDGGVFKPLASMLVAPVTADVLQMMIDSIAENLPPIGLPAEEEADEVGEIMDRLREAGWHSAEDAIAELDRLREKSAFVEDVLRSAGVETLQELVTKARELAEAGDAKATQLAAAIAERDELASKVEALTADLAAAKAKPTKSKPTAAA